MEEPARHKVNLNRHNDKSRLVFSIVGGVEAEINKYPYSAQYGVSCAAAIIGERWALSAAHCRPHSYILVGSKYINRGKNISVQFLHHHPGWIKVPREHFVDYDFRLLELAEPLNFDDPNIKPVKIARLSDMVIGKLVTVTGWGDTTRDGKAPEVLQAVEVPIVSKEICQKLPAVMFNGTLTPRMFCAGDKAGYKDACQGDSGGPAVADGRLLGTVSFGYGCATPNYYGVYSNVAVVRDWIKEITGLILD